MYEKKGSILDDDCQFLDLKDKKGKYTTIAWFNRLRIWIPTVRVLPMGYTSDTFSCFKSLVLL